MPRHRPHPCRVRVADLAADGPRRRWRRHAIPELLGGARPQLPLLVLPTYQQAERIPERRAAEQGELFR